MNNDDLKKALYILANYIMKIQAETYPLSKDNEWMESAISVIARVIQKITADEKVTGDAD